MSVRDPSTIRNMLLAGHAGAGKTLLIERLLHAAGATTRMGSIEEGNTVTDWSEESRKHGHSLSSNLAHYERNGVLVNLIDTPGLADFFGQAIAALPAAGLVAVVVDASKGIEANTRRIMATAKQRNIPRMIVINKIDDAQADLQALLERIREAFGRECVPVNLPSEDRQGVVDVLGENTSGKTLFGDVDSAHTHIVEQVVEVDDDLMAQYLEGGAASLDRKAVHDAFERALREAHLVPVCFASAKTGAGAQALLDFIESQCPSPLETNPRTFEKLDDDGNVLEAFEPACDPKAPLIAHVFKVSSDPYVGRLGVMKIHQGTLKLKDEVFFGDGRKPVRVNTLFRLQGKDHVDVPAAGPGDIVAVSKVEEAAYNVVVHAHANEHLRLRPLPLPRPMYGLAITLPNHKDEAKFAPAIAKLQAEDPCLVMERVAATRETVLRGLGEMHLRVLIERLKSQFGIELQTHPPKIAYKETVTTTAEGHHRHKKQTGGSGEFGEVFLRVAPLNGQAEGVEERFRFVNATVGGSIPKQFMPAIEKGIRQALEEGAIAGYPIEGVQVEVYDGKYHPVDSKEVAFIKAGKKAFVEACRKAKPALLEPYVQIEVTAPAQYMGDITGDLSTRRGRVQDSFVDGETCVVRAVAPLGTLQNYANELKSMTHGTGSYVMDYSHDERTPPNVQAEVVAAYDPHAEED
ncbi:MAG: elongation factor G [Phycisphaerales bacterium]|nr:MAG: elongation factor G [Phycisphaerales bacterium]